MCVCVYVCMCMYRCIWTFCKCECIGLCIYWLLFFVINLCIICVNNYNRHLSFTAQHPFFSPTIFSSIFLGVNILYSFSFLTLEQFNSIQWYFNLNSYLIRICFFVEFIARLFKHCQCIDNQYYFDNQRALIIWSAQFFCILGFIWSDFNPAIICGN